MIKKVNATVFCESYINKYKGRAHIDYLICGDSIKIFFYFRSNTTECHTHLAADLNNSLMTYDLQTMCDFYMKLIPVKNCTKYDLCWVFLSFDVAGDYYVQRHLWT